MSHKDYHNYSKPYQQPQNAQPVAEKTQNVVETVSAETEPVLDATVPEPDKIVETTTVEAAPELPTTVTGVVSGCNKLNVRNRPSTTAAILTTINAGDEVVIEQLIVDDDFYKVTLANGTTGYCMKKFISVK